MKPRRRRITPPQHRGHQKQLDLFFSNLYCSAAVQHDKNKQTHTHTHKSRHKTRRKNK